MKTIRNKWRLEEDKETKWIIKTWSLSASLWRIQEEHLVFWTFQRKVAGDFITVWSRETLRGRKWWSDWLLAFLSKEKVYQSPMRQVYQCLKFTKSELCVLEEGKRRLLVLSDLPNENEHKGWKAGDGESERSEGRLVQHTFYTLCTWRTKMCHSTANQRKRSDGPFPICIKI